MIEVVLDTETTGLSVADGHRIVEIGCIELKDLIPTKKIFHSYINPERKVSEEAFKVHGYTDEFLSRQKKFSEIVEDFLKFIDGKKLIIHNAEFDISHLNNELSLLGRNKIKEEVVDTMQIARGKFPGSGTSLDALCKKFSIDNSKREKHNALIDCHLLKDVYINLIDQKEPKLDLESSNISDSQYKENFETSGKVKRKIVKPSTVELQLHKDYLKSYLQKNFYD